RGALFGRRLGNWRWLGSRRRLDRRWGRGGARSGKRVCGPRRDRRGLRGRRDARLARGGRGGRKRYAFDRSETVAGDDDGALDLPIAVAELDEEAVAGLAPERHEAPLGGAADAIDTDRGAGRIDGDAHLVNRRRL